jgi:hypothetical protein
MATMHLLPIILMKLAGSGMNVIEGSDDGV